MKKNEEMTPWPEGFRHGKKAEVIVMLMKKNEHHISYFVTHAYWIACASVIARLLRLLLGNAVGNVGDTSLFGKVEMVHHGFTGRLWIFLLDGIDDSRVMTEKE